MKKKELSFEIWVYGMIIILLICIIISACFERKMDANLASIMGGALSAIATVFVGLVAIWQNNRFKKMTDQANDIQVRPEFFVTYFPAHTNEYYNLPALTIYPTRLHCQSGGPQDELLCCCKVLNFPVVRVKPKRLFYSIDNQPADNYSEFEKQSVPNLILEKDQVFRVFIKKYVTLCDMYLEVEFENIYGDRYLKVIEFTAPSKNELPEASVFGTLASGTIKMKPAIKVSDD